MATGIHWIPVVLLAAALLAPTVRAQPRPMMRGPQPRQQQRTAQTRQPPASVSGTVVNAITKEPLRKVQVMLRAVDGRGPAYAATTNDGGQFTISGVEPGRYRFGAERTGFVTQSSFPGRSMGRSAEAEVKPGQDITGLTVELMPQAVITGKVMDEDGEAMQGVTVQVARLRYVSGRRELAAVGMGVSNDLGEYRVYNLPPGRYYVSAAKRFGGFRQFLGPGRGGMPEVEEDYITMYYPGVPDPELATPLDLRPGMEMRGVDLRIAKGNVYRVRGQVLGLPAEPVEGGRPAPVMVSLVPKGAAGSLLERLVARVNPADASFEIQRVRPGSYTLVAILASPRDARFGRVPVEVGERDTDGVAVTLHPPVKLVGSVRVEEGSAGGGLTVVLIHTDAFLSRFSEPVRVVKVDSNGRFEADRLSPARYRVSVRNTPEGYYLKSARLGPQDVLAPGIDLSGGIAGASLELLIGPGAGVVEGTVQNEDREGVAGVTVTLVPQAENSVRLELYRTASSGEGGTFRIPSVPPGDYKLYAWEKIEPGAYQDPDFLRPFESRAVTVRIGENGRENVSLRVITAAESEGTL